MGRNDFYTPAQLQRASGSNEQICFIKIIDTSGLFTLKVPDSNSNSDCKPNGYIVIYRIFRVAYSQIQIPIPIADYRNRIGIGLESKSASVNVNKPL